ncbi:MAG: hypothetical protein LAQ69_46090, partial [Acidobacteriia bacterium]|nr:hypothetical protein [Terriglobia bacterium]
AMQYRRKGTVGDFAQGQSGGSGVIAESGYQTAREFDGEGHFGIADRHWMLYGIEDRHHRLLYDFVFQRRDADRPLPTVRFLQINPP